MNRKDIQLVLLGLYIQAVGNLALVLSKDILISQLIILCGIFLTIRGLYQNSKSHESRIDRLEKAMREADKFLKKVEEKN